MTDPQTIDSAREIGTVAAFAAAAGGLQYGLKVTEGHKFSWAELLLHVGTSAFAGMCSYQICIGYFAVDPQLAGALSGISGWLGTRILRIGEIVFKRKLEQATGLEKGELDDK